MQFLILVHQFAPDALPDPDVTAEPRADEPLLHRAAVVVHHIQERGVGAAQLQRELAIALQSVAMPALVIGAVLTLPHQRRSQSRMAEHPTSQ